MAHVVTVSVWTAFDNLFNTFPLAAIVNKRILCVHGGIGRVDRLEQIRQVPRPVRVEHDPSKGEHDQVLMDVLWSDPAETDADLGVTENRARRVSVVFGADRVLEFCAANDIDVIVRAHQCVMEGYEYFARGHLITIFSATNYCGVQKNNGALLHVTDRQDHWLVTPKFIECTDSAAPTQTWVNLERMPPSPMRSGRRLPGSAGAPGPFDADAFPSLAFNLGPTSAATASAAGGSGGHVSAPSSPGGTTAAASSSPSAGSMFASAFVTAATAVPPSRAAPRP